jgi:hemerythrin-like domain-containing protein
MNRYNVFNQVHKGLRSLLYETALLLQQTDFSSKEEAQTAIEKLADVIELFEKHADSEDNNVLPAIRQYEPSVVLVFEEEHEQDHTLSRKLEELIFVLKHSINEDTKKETGKIINTAFTEFMVFNLNHMAKEETVLNKLLWRYYSDEELHALTQQIVSRLSPEIMGKFSRWMIRGLSNPEIVTWLKQVQHTMPVFVFKGLMHIAEKELAHHRWQEVSNQVVEEEMVMG